MVELNFTMATGSWIVGKALSEMFDLDYHNEETVSFIKATIEKSKLNEALSKVELVTGSKQSQHGNVNVIEFITEPAGDQFQMNDKQWNTFKDWLKTNGKVLNETQDSITIADKDYAENKNETDKNSN